MSPYVPHFWTPFSTFPRQREANLQSAYVSGGAAKRHYEELRLFFGTATQARVVYQPSGDVSLTVQYAPNVDVIIALNVENQIRVSRQRPGA